MARSARVKVKKPARPAATRRAPAPRGGTDAGIAAMAAAALARGEPDAVPDDVLRKTLAAAVKVYAAKAPACARASCAAEP